MTSSRNRAAFERFRKRRRTPSGRRVAFTQWSTRHGGRDDLVRGQGAGIATFRGPRRTPSYASILFARSSKLWAIPSGGVVRADADPHRQHRHGRERRQQSRPRRSSSAQKELQHIASTSALLIGASSPLTQACPRPSIVRNSRRVRPARSVEPADDPMSVASRCTALRVSRNANWGRGIGRRAHRAVALLGSTVVSSSPAQIIARKRW